MASLRMLKKDIDCLIEEIVSDCYLTIYFHPEKEQEVVQVMREAVELRNGLYDRANSPAEKNNRHLVKRHYSQLRRDMFTGVDKLFTDLSSLTKN